MRISLFTLVFLLIASFSFAQSSFYALSLFLNSEYTDNLYLTNADKTDDVISVFGASFAANRATKISSMDLSYSLSRSYYWNREGSDSFRHNLSFDYDRSLSKHLNFSWKNIYYRTEEPIEPSTLVFEERRGERRPYYRINSSLDTSYEYYKNSFVRFGLSLNYLQNESPLTEDSRSYTEFVSLSRDFVKYFIESRFSATQREFEQTPSVQTWSAEASGGYKIAHNKKVSLKFSIDRTQDKSPTGEDYWVYSSDVTYSWNPTRKDSYHFSLGYFVKKGDDKGKDSDGITFSLDYSRKFRLTTFSISGSGGYRYRYVEAENTGFTKYYLISADISRKLSRRTSVSSSFSYRWEDDLRGVRNTYVFSAAIAHQITKKISGSISYSFRKVSADYSQDEYTVNTVFLSFSYRFWQAKHLPWNL